MRLAKLRSLLGWNLQPVHDVNKFLQILALLGKGHLAQAWAKQVESASSQVQQVRGPNANVLDWRFQLQQIFSIFNVLALSTRSGQDFRGRSPAPSR